MSGPTLRQRFNLQVGNCLKLLLRPAGLTLTPLRRRGEYIDAAETQAAAAAAGQTVPEYVAALWGEEGVVERVIAELTQCGALAPCERTVEIGPGTGRYLEAVLAQIRPTTYDIYELDDAWAEYLTRKYRVTCAATDGEALTATPTASCGLVQAHNVFVYLPILTAFSYFREMVRVCAPAGFVVFDFYSDQHVTEEDLLGWLRHPERYQVVLPERLVEEFFGRRGFRLVHRFANPCLRGSAEYLVFRNDRGG
jgi:hypothetical protein